MAISIANANAISGDPARLGPFGHGPAPFITGPSFTDVRIPEPAMSNDAFPFEKLEVYQLAVRLAGVVREILEQIPPGHSDLCNHLGRSERSIRLNTAEGSGRRPAAQKVHRYDTARASANECAAALAEVRVFELAERRLVDEADALLRRITKMLTRLIQRWRPNA